MNKEIFDNNAICDEVIIEELDCNDVPESEWAEFAETQPLQAIEIDDSMEVENAVLAFDIVGTDFPNLFNNSTEIEEDDDEADVDEDDDEMLKSNQLSITNLNADLPSTSKDAQLIQQLGERYENEKETRAFKASYRRSALTATQKSLMGEANLALINQNTETAEELCLEIIRQNRFASEPYFTLAGIYETQNLKKYIFYLTCAVNLEPNNRDLWIRLANIHCEQGDLQMARKYYAMATKILCKDWNLRYRKAEISERLGDIRLAMNIYYRTLPLIPPEEGQICLHLAKRITLYFEKEGKRKNALNTMETTYNRFRELFTFEDLNLYLELLLLTKDYKKVVSCLKKHTQIQVDLKENGGVGGIYFCSIPDDCIPQFRSKLCVALIKMQMFHLIGYLLQNIQKHMPANIDNLDMYMDIVEALMQEQKNVEAIMLIKSIIDSQEVECPAFVWLRRAECLQKLERIDESIESYERVVQLAPSCFEAKFALASLLKQQGYHEEAVNALEQPYEEEAQPLHARLLYERCQLLHDIGRDEEFIDAGYKLLSRHSLELKNREEVIAVTSGGTAYNTAAIKTIIQLRSLIDGETANDKKFLQAQKNTVEDESDLKVEDEYKLYKELQCIAYKNRQYEAMLRLSLAMLTTKRFLPYKSDIERAMVLTCYFNKDWQIMFSFLRELINRDAGNVSLWNLLGLLWQEDNNIRYYRYLRRLIKRKPETSPLRIIFGHFHLQCGSYKYALKNYKPIFEQTKDPLTVWCIAVVFSQISTHRRILRKSSASGQAISFAQLYATLRAGSEPENAPVQQEINFNLGRFYHQAGLLHIAADYYERAINSRHPLIETDAARLSLRQEAAFNLHLIYKASNNLDKAREILFANCVL